MRLQKIIIVGFVLIFGWLLCLAGWINRYGSKDHAIKADCVIVLGAAIWGEKPSPVFEERIRHALLLQRTNFAPKILFTGGKAEDCPYSESSVASHYAQLYGIPADSILIEEKSRSTFQNLSEAALLMQEYNLHSAIIVSDPLHMARAMTMAKAIGISAVSSPTPTSHYRSKKARLIFLFREVGFFHQYFLFGR